MSVAFHVSRHGGAVVGKGKSKEEGWNQLFFVSSSSFPRVQHIVL